MNLENFELNYGPSGEQALGTILDNGTSYQFTAGDNVYTIPYGASSDFFKGYVGVKERFTQKEIITIAGPGTINSAGTYVAPTTGTLISHSIVGGNTVEAIYTDNIDGTDRQRRHTYRPQGGAVVIKVEAYGATKSTDYLNNYNGFYGGDFDATLDRAYMDVPGTFAVPVLAGVDTDGDPLFFSHFMDITRSHASDITLTAPSTHVGSDAERTYSTLNQYETNTGGSLQNYMSETLCCIASSNFSEAAVHPNDRSAQHQRIVGKVWTFLTSRDDWVNFSGHFNDWYDWGIRDAVIYPQFWWTEINYPPEIQQNNGHNWYPAGDPTGQANFGDLVTGLGYDVGGYTYWGVENTGVSTYQSGNRVLDSNGDPVATKWGAYKYVTKEDLVYHAYMTGQLTSIRDDYSWNMIRYDVSTYADPSEGGGDSVDMDDGSPCGTLSGALKIRRGWMYSGKLLLDDNGYAFGEGGLASYKTDNEYLYAGAIDGNHQWWVTDSQVSWEDPDYPADRTIATIPMVLDHQWGMTNQYFAHTNNNPGRMFTVHDEHLQEDDIDGLYPFSKAMHDRMRTYAFALGRCGANYYASNGLQGFSYAKEQVKEYYLVNQFTKLSRNLTVPTVTYFYDDATREETLEQLWSRVGRKAFVEIKAKLTFSKAHEVYVNRSNSDWVTPGPFGGSITIPTDGYMAVRIIDNRLEIGGSMISELAPSQRIDISYKPGQFLLVDGRDVVQEVLGHDMNAAKWMLKNYTLGFQLHGTTQRPVLKTDL